MYPDIRHPHTGHDLRNAMVPTELNMPFWLELMIFYIIQDISRFEISHNLWPGHEASYEWLGSGHYLC